MHRIFTIKSVLALAVAGALIGLGCSDQPDLLGPADESGDPPRGDRQDYSFNDYLQGSLSASYATITGSIDGQEGGMISGTVASYGDSFSLAVPAGAYTGKQSLSIKVPEQWPPVYQLLPGGSFNEELTVTLNYAKWVTEGAFAQGDTLELVYMNEQTQEFETLDPPAVVVADSAGALITFATDHFSRWGIKGH